MKKSLFIPVCLGMMSSSLLAVESNSNKELAFKTAFNFFMEVGIQGGGDGTEPLPIYDRSTDGYVIGAPYTLTGDWKGVNSALDQYWEDDVEAGGLYKFALGMEIPLVESFTLIASVGYQFDEVYGDLQDGSGGKGSFQYMRNTIELIPFYNFGRHRIGLGAEVHYSPKAIHKEYSADFNLKTTYDFEDAYGAVIRYDYLVNKNTSVGIKYTQISYNFERLRTYYQSEGVTIANIEAACLSNCDDLVEANSVGVHLTYRF